MNTYSILYTNLDNTVLHKTLHADSVQEVIHLMSVDHDIASHNIISINPRIYY